MDAKYLKMVEELVAELLAKYISRLENTQDEYEYCTLITAVLVFKELILVDFRKSILRDSNDDPNDICQIIDCKAREISETIRSRFLNIQQSLN